MNQQNRLILQNGAGSQPAPLQPSSQSHMQQLPSQLQQQQIQQQQQMQLQLQQQQLQQQQLLQQQNMAQQEPLAPQSQTNHHSEHVQGLQPATTQIQHQTQHSQNIYQQPQQPVVSYQQMSQHQQMTHVQPHQVITTTAPSHPQQPTVDESSNEGRTGLPSSPGNSKGSLTPTAGLTQQQYQIPQQPGHSHIPASTYAHISTSQPIPVHSQPSRVTQQHTMPPVSRPQTEPMQNEQHEYAQPEQVPADPPKKHPFGNPNVAHFKRVNTQPPPERATRLPVSRIKTIMKFDPDVNIITQEAAYLLAKATEEFLTGFAKSAYESTMTGKRKTLQKKDLDVAILSQDRFCFLDGIDLSIGNGS